MTWFMSLFLLIAACVLNYVICVCNWKDMSSFILGIFAFSFILCLSTSCLSKVLLAWQLWLPTDSFTKFWFISALVFSLCLLLFYISSPTSCSPRPLSAVSQCHAGCSEVDSLTEAVAGEGFLLGCISCKRREEVPARATVDWHFKPLGEEEFRHVSSAKFSSDSGSGASNKNVTGFFFFLSLMFFLVSWHKHKKEQHCSGPLSTE